MLKLGLPNITDPSILPGCAGLLGLPPCNDTSKRGTPCCGRHACKIDADLTKDFYADFGRRPPVYAPYTTPVYSNIGYSILALAVEAASNTSFADFIQKNILDVVGMPHTSLSAPNADAGFIAVNETWWDAVLGVENPYGIPLPPCKIR